MIPYRLNRRTAINLILAFAVALKHRLRFEPHAHYSDLSRLVLHLDTFASAAHDRSSREFQNKPKSGWKVLMQYLGLANAEVESRKEMKSSKTLLGNLPLEIIMHLNAYYHSHVSGDLGNTAVLTQICKN